MNISTKLAFQNVLRHPVRSLLTIGGISLGVAVILAVSMLNDSMRHSMERTIEELGSGQTDLWVEESSETTTSFGTRYEGFSEDIMPNLLHHPAIVSVHPALKIYVLGKSDLIQEPVEFYLYGVRLQDDQTIRDHLLLMGDYPTDAQHILIGQQLAKALHISVGSLVAIQSPKGLLTLHVSGLLRPDEGSGVLHNNRVAFADLAVIQEYFHYPDRLTALNIVLKSGVNPVEVAEQIKGMFPANVNVMTDPLMVATKGDESGPLRVVLMIYSGISIWIAMFLIYNTLSSTVEERKKEIGMLRLIGMTAKQILWLFLRQAFIYAGLGSCAGIGVGMILGWGMISLLQQLFTYQAFSFMLPSAQSFLIAIGTGILVTMVVAMVPAVKTTHIPPLVVFREQEDVQTVARRFTGRHLVGSLLIGGAMLPMMLSISGTTFAVIRLLASIPMFIGVLLLLGYLVPFGLRLVSWGFAKLFGVPGLLAARSLHLRLKRTVVTIGAILIATAIAVATVSIVVNMKQTTSDWLDTTKWADVLVFSASGAVMDESIVETLKMVPWIQHVNPIRYFFVSYDHPKLSDQGFLLQAVDPDRFKAVTGIDVPEGDALVINAGLATMLGIKPGDTMTLKTRQGETDFTIVASVVDYTDFVHRLGKIVYGSYHTLAQHWGASGYTILQIRLTKGYSENDAKQYLLRELSGTYDIKILTHSEEKAEVGASIDRIFASNYAITAIMFLIVFMGMFNTVFINVLFQLREFAVLRTVGLLVRQVRLMTICEALAMGLIGSILAMFAGIWLGWQMMLGTRELMGILFQFHIPWIIVGITFGLMPLIAICATFYPQKIVSDLSIVQIMQRGELL